MMLEKPLKQALQKVKPGLLGLQNKNKLSIRKEEFEQIFYFLLTTMPVEEAYQQIKKLNQYLIQNGFISHEENPGISVTKIKRPKSRITVDITQDIKQIVRLENQFILMLGYDETDTDDLAGKIIFSAIRYGYLLDQKLITSLVEKLSYPINIFGSHVWFELGKDNVSIWSPDPLTLLLLQKWYCNKHNQNWRTRIKKITWFHLICKVFKAKKNKQNLFGLTKTRLLKAINARLSLLIPPVLADCASAIHNARTLHPDVYLRLITGKTPKLTKSNVNKLKESRKRTKININVSQGNNVGYKDDYLLKKVGQFIRSSQKNKNCIDQIDKLLDEEGKNCTPISQYLCLWVARRLGNPNRWGNRFKLSSAYTRLTSISRRMRSWFGAEEPTQMSGDQLLEIYEEIIDSIGSSQNKKSIARNIRDFHEYLEDDWNVEPLDETPWSRVLNLPDGVDSKIILPNEYEAASKYFYNKQSSTKDLNSILNKSRFIILSLGYKCGLRRREVIGLRIKDLTLVGAEEILIRPHEMRGLKSTSGNRRIPISVLLNQTELKTLIDWVNNRKKEGAKGEDYLFDSPLVNTPFIESSLIFDEIQIVLKIITGDASARFHHLRHSYATFAFWRWMLPHNLNNEQYYKGIPALNEKRVYQERKVILGLDQGNEPSQKISYALSMLVGHAGPTMTLEHYIHSHQWLTHQLSIKHSPILPTKIIASLLSVSMRQVQKLVKNKNCTASEISKNTLKKIKHFSFTPECKGWQDPKIKKIIEIKSKPSLSENSDSILWEALQWRSYHNIPAQRVIERYCLPEDAFIHAWKNAKMINDIKRTGRGHHSFRHRLKEWERLENPPILLRFPRQKRHLDLVVSILKKYSKLTKSKKSLVQWGINYFLHNSLINKTGINFSKKAELNKFIKVINTLEVSAISNTKVPKKIDRFRLTLFTQWDTKNQPENIENQWKYWNKSLDIKAYQKRIYLAKTETHKHGRISLDVMSLQAETSSKTESKLSRQSDWGFRLGLYVIAYFYL